MKRISLALLFISALLLPMGALAAKNRTSPTRPVALYIAPTPDGFQVALMAAMQKKHVPVTLSTDATNAQFTLGSSPVQIKTQSTGSKFARCIFADCIGIQDRSSVAVQMTDEKSKQVVWAYTVHKQRGGAMNDQSMAEAVAKHLKDFMQQHPFPQTPVQSPLTALSGASGVPVTAAVDTQGKK